MMLIMSVSDFMIIFLSGNNTDALHELGLSVEIKSNRKLFFFLLNKIIRETIIPMNLF